MGFNGAYREVIFEPVIYGLSIFRVNSNRESSTVVIIIFHGVEYAVRHAIWEASVKIKHFYLHINKVGE